MSALLDAARHWAEHDPDPQTKEELLQLIRAEDEEELSVRFAGPLSFGTAGLRGKIGAGESCMNQATVMKATAGLAEWLTSQVDSPLVVVGCDARHGSAQFHEATCSVLSAAGCRVLALPPQLPTPVTAASVRHYEADAGIMVTASHNPPQDNGYKVYLGGRVCTDDDERGVQLISPADREIAERIAATPPADEIPVSTEGITNVGEEALEAYLSRVCSLVPHSPRSLPIVITAMHGVGGHVLHEALRRCGFQNIIPVAEQFDPDPDFPTVSFPNPEEEGALDLAIATAEREGAALILALDPDADRCSVALREGTRWVQLSGDRVGALLGEDCARRWASEPDAATATMACSIVSSRILEKIAEHHGLAFQPTLTGFKWIGRTPGLIFGYEEALGYCTDPRYVRDKDGVSACLRVADLASRVDLSQLGAEIDATYGVYLTRPLTLRFTDPAQIRESLAAIMVEPPSALGGSAVTSTTDLSTGYRELPGTPGMVLDMESGDRVVIRPSGTEPKLKCYLETVASDRADAERRMDAIEADLSQALGMR